MRKTLSTLTLALALSGLSQAAELQGVIADWKCVKGMVRNGREKTFKQNHSCSLQQNFKRAAYGLITDDKKFYRLDDPGNGHVLGILGDSPSKDSVRVIVHGELQGNTIKVVDMSLL